MTATIRIELEARPLERITCDVAVAGFFSEDRPLRGGAARMDWRLCGLLSSLLIEERITGSAGEAVLVPGTGALRAPRAMIVGLGSRASFPLTAAQDAMRDAAKRCFALGVRRVAMAPLGVSSDDLPRHAVAIVGGVVEAARSFDRPLDLILAVPGNQHDAARVALDRAIRAVAPEPISLHAEAPSLVKPARTPRGPSAYPV